MPTFTKYDTLPSQSFNPSKNYSDNPLLSILGYNQDGSQNLAGQITSWIPGYSQLANVAAQGITQGTDSNAGVQGDFKTRMDKLLLEAAVAGTVLTAGAAAPAIAPAAGAALAIPATAGAAAGAGSAAGIGTATLATTAGKYGVDLLQNAGKQAGQDLINGTPQNKYLTPKNDLSNYTNY